MSDPGTELDLWTRVKRLFTPTPRQPARHSPETVHERMAADGSYLRAELLDHFRSHPGHLVRVADIAADPDKVREAINVLRDQGEPIGEALAGEAWMYLPPIERQGALQDAGHIDAGPYWHH